MKCVGTLVYELPSGDQFHHATLFRRKRSAVRYSRSFFRGKWHIESGFVVFVLAKAGNNVGFMQGVFG